MPPLAAGLSWIDLEFQGNRRVIATAVAQGGGRVALIDPGPSSCLPVLERELNRQGIAWTDVTDLLLTHIHLDHAGAAGTLVRRNPSIRVRVHERGAPHVADPSKLLQSATRLYGEAMDRLWGEVLPVPEDRLVALEGGERVDAGGRRFEVAYTPGHASHHVSYFDRASGTAFVGDTAGVCVDGGYVLPPTPPPDIDVEQWRRSVERIDAWRPATLFLTHFGPAPTVSAHLQTLLDNLSRLSGLVRAGLETPDIDDARRQAQFGSALRLELRRTMTDAKAAAYEAAAPLDMLWPGLARYWRKRGVGAGASG